MDETERRTDRVWRLMEMKSGLHDAKILHIATPPFQDS